MISPLEIEGNSSKRERISPFISFRVWIFIENRDRIERGEGGIEGGYLSERIGRNIPFIFSPSNSSPLHPLIIPLFLGVVKV